MLRPWISALEIEEVRTFKDHRLVQLDKRLTVVAGVNNAGKSTILHSILAAVHRSAGTGIPHEPQRTGERPATYKVHFAFDSSELRDAEPDLTAKCLEYFDIVDLDKLRLVAGLSPGHAGLEIAYEEQARLRFDQNNILGIVAGSAVQQRHQSAKSVDGLWTAGQRAARSVGFWRNDGSPDAREGAGYRLLSNDVDVVGARLTALRLNHPIAFGRLEDALKEAFKELEAIYFLPTGGTYRPTLKLKSSHIASTPVTREAFGAGLWTFLCVLLACRLAHETGAGTMVLDEPTAFMHPSLERLLFRELTGAGKWNDAPMQLVIATHSPVFVEEAMRGGTLQVVEWEDRESALTRITAVEPVDEDGSYVRRSADFLYARTVLFVEGKSDEAALWELRRLVQVPCYVMAPGTKDWYLSPATRSERRVTGGERLSTLASLAHVRGGGPARVMLDEDARTAASKLLDKRGVTEIERTVFVGGDGQDFESLFCERTLLVDFFKRGSPDSAADEGIAAKVDAALATTCKGCEVIAGLFDQLGGGQLDKQTMLAQLAAHYAARPENFSRVGENLKDVLNVYDAGEA